MKIAISIPEDVFQEVEKYAAEHECSRSEVFVRAVTDFFEKKRNEKLLRTINEVYGVPENKEDIKARKASRIHFRKTVLDKEPSY
jgi:metal-responsive CopG/Arc/MetJ family transcriptional regulator